MRENIKYTLGNLLDPDIFKEKYSCSYVCFPNNRNPKLLFPVGLTSKGLVSALDLYPVITKKHFLKKSLISLLYYLSFLFPEYLRLKLGSHSFPRNLYGLVSGANLNGQNKIIHCCIRTGSIGKGRKLIIQFQDKCGEVISYVKLGDAEYRGKWLENERKILSYLNTHCSDIITVPKVLSYITSEKYTALELEPITEFLYFPKVPYHKMAIILSRLAEKTKTKCKYNFDEQEAKIPAIIHDTKTKALIIRYFNMLREKGTYWSLAHRDMPAWNVMSNSNMGIAILDWEFAQHGYNPFQDMFHYIIHTNLHNSGKTPEKVLIDFFKHKSNTDILKRYAEKLGITDPQTIFAYFVLYLWDWFMLERSNAENDEQGMQYYSILKYLAHNENSNKYFI